MTLNFRSAKAPNHCPRAVRRQCALYVHLVYFWKLTVWFESCVSQRKFRRKTGSKRPREPMSTPTPAAPPRGGAQIVKEFEAARDSRDVGDAVAAIKATMKAGKANLSGLTLSNALLRYKPVMTI